MQLVQGRDSLASLQRIQGDYGSEAKGNNKRERGASLEAKVVMKGGRS